MIPARGLRITRLDPDGAPTGPAVVGLGAMTFQPMIEATEATVDAFRGMATATFQVSFQPSRALRRLVLGPRWAWDRRRARTVSRRKALARRGRR